MQDTRQRLHVVVTILIELYRVISCSLLIIFVPQKCGTHVCTVSENVAADSLFYNAGLIFNFLTLFAFLPLYTTEFVRENRLIKYLDVNPDLPSENEAVGNVLVTLPLIKRTKILEVDGWYRRVGYAVIFMYIFNTCLSAGVISHYYLNDQTVSVFFTNVLYMCTKFIHVYNVINTDENIFYSGYLLTNVQYNDIDTSFKV